MYEKTIKYPKLSAGLIAKTTVFVIGLICVIISVLMSLTIIMFIPGFFGMIFGGALIAVAMPKVWTTCGTCGINVEVVLGAREHKCEGCKNTMRIKWRKE